MTFHDDIHSNAEKKAYRSAKYLVLWLKTIAPIGGVEYANSLLDLAEDMGWPKVDRGVIGDEIL